MKVGIALLVPVAGFAHMVSMSTGELKIHGNTADYELRMPSYEAAHIQNPGQTLLAHIRFRGAGAEGKLTRQNCGPLEENYVCTASYEFPVPVEQVEVECTFASVTVPNHIHLLRAYRDDKTDQAVFDISFTTAEIRFRPPAPWNIFLRESGAGFLRAAGGFAPLLFLLSLALAARSRREMWMLILAFLVGETGACSLVPRLTVYLSPRFIEAAAVLTVAYLAFEIILLPESGQRWLVVGILGFFHGMYFSLFLGSSGYGLFNFLAGVLTAQTIVVTAFHFFWSKVFGWIRWPRALPATASVLLATGITWFAVRVWTP